MAFDPPIPHAGAAAAGRRSPDGFRAMTASATDPPAPPLARRARAPCRPTGLFRMAKAMSVFRIMRPAHNLRHYMQ
jgi:hypothetical protein